MSRLRRADHHGLTDDQFARTDAMLDRIICQNIDWLSECAAIGLYAAHYNFCRVHDTLRITPAMQLGISDHVWTVSELVHACLTGEIQQRADAQRNFQVIRGDKP